MQSCIAVSGVVKAERRSPKYFVGERCSPKYFFPNDIRTRGNGDTVLAVVKV